VSDLSKNLKQFNAMSSSNPYSSTIHQNTVKSADRATQPRLLWLAMAHQLFIFP